MADGKLIDLVSQWVDARKGAYLAKENTLVYYSSLTGRKGDYSWHSLTLDEVVRIITATQLNPLKVEGTVLQKKHVVAACQELGRVFEFGIKSNHAVAPEIFNFLAEADMDMDDAIVSMIADELFAEGYSAMLLKDVVQCCELTSANLKVKVSTKRIRDLIHKYFPPYGYEIRTDKYRPQIDGRKQAAVMLFGTKPKQVVNIQLDNMTRLAKKIEGALK